MKYLKYAAALMLISAAAYSYSPPERNLAVIDSFSNYSTCYAIQVASMTAAAKAATPMLNGTAAASGFVINKAAGVRDLDITNLDATNDIYCGDAVTVSTATVPFSATLGKNVNHGAAGAAGTEHLFILAPDEQWYCANNGTTGTTIAEVCVGR